MRLIFALMLLLVGACAPKPVVEGAPRPIQGTRPALGPLTAQTAAHEDPAQSMAGRVARLRARAQALRATPSSAPPAQNTNDTSDN